MLHPLYVIRHHSSVITFVFSLCFCDGRRTADIFSSVIRHSFNNSLPLPSSTSLSIDKEL